ncbi:ABC transporter substrate-binding protein [Sinorhizobium mexicanum]|uniref:Transporter substrate-binding domain-containing protein n=1 Tax=Sinorhizobium mexicanum TaxID=375549 RepID=A0A859QEH1_9HYPH|nr:ABC transporter substrate-binding protein [Sinorhizobium mexicanum]MBP1888004.1 sulfonate transport system substrate-binding protein [Sinorhizobium mexicanum]QLL60015.1 transporter substrate-binding domain-containing protein [Sinorhizobium mexicanum]
MRKQSTALKTGIAAFFSTVLATSSLADDPSLPTRVPPGVKIVLADDANNAASLLRLSGEYDKLAADVSFANFTSGPLRLEAIRAGAAQVGAVGDVPPILAHFSGADVVIVGVVVTEGPTTIIATAPDSGIKELKDLKGKKVGINPGTAQQAIVFRNLRATGLTPEDIVPINLGLAEFADALRAGQIDAAVLKQPDRARYLKSVPGTGATEIASAGDGNKNLKILYASKTALADPSQAAAIRDLVVHWYRAHLWKNDNAETWAKQYLIKDQRLSEEDAKSVIDAETGKTYIPGWKTEIIPRQQDTINLLQAAGNFKGKELKAEDEFDHRFDGLNNESKSAAELHPDG